MREVAEDIEEMFEPLQITEGYRGRAPIIPHKAFGKIRFRPGSEKRTGRRFELGQDAHLCIDKASPDVEENRAYLKDHTLLARSFATFVPTSSVFLGPGRLHTSTRIPVDGIYPEITARSHGPVLVIWHSSHSRSQK